MTTTHGYGTLFALPIFREWKKKINTGDPVTDVLSLAAFIKSRAGDNAPSWDACVHLATTVLLRPEKPRADRKERNCLADGLKEALVLLSATHNTKELARLFDVADSTVTQTIRRWKEEQRKKIDEALGT